MATATFKTIVCNAPHGDISLHFLPATAPNPFFGPISGSSITPGMAVSLGNVTRTFSSTAKVTLSLKTTNGTFTANRSISSTGSKNLLFTIGTSKFTVTCDVV